MPKARKGTKRAAKAAADMTTADAVVATLIAHGLDAIYAVPGVQNDQLFEALFRFSDRLRTIHTRHEQGAAYMALGAALATGKPQAYAVVPGPGLLNSAAALLTAYSMNAPVLGLIGQIPNADIGQAPRPPPRDSRPVRHHQPAGRSFGADPETGTGITRHRAGDARDENRPAGTGRARMPDRRLGSIRSGDVASAARDSAGQARHDAIRKAAKLLGAAKRPMIVCGGGAQDASEEITALSAMLQAPVLGYRRGRGVLDSRDPLSVTLPLGRDLWGEADVVLAVGTRLLIQLRQWGVDRDLKIVRVDADPEEHARVR